LYPAGSNLVLYPLDQKTQKFIPVSEMGDSISAISLSLNKKFLAIAERGVNSTMPLVVIYDLVTMRRKKVLQISEGDSKEIVSLCMSCDAKYVVTQTGAPDWTLTYWNWEKGKILGSVRSSNVNNAPVTHVSFNPHDITQVCVTGDGIFKLYRYSEGMVKQFGFQKIEVKTIHCHSWLSEDRVAVALDEGQIFLFESGEHKATFNIFESESEISKKTSILSLLSYSKGFAYGTSHGIIGLFERTEDKELYRKSREFKLKEDNVKITSLALSPSEDNLICGLETNQMYAISLSNVDIKAEELQMDLVAQPFHHGQITGLDTCLRKPLIVTCSNDRSVRLWNYLDNSIELVKYFPEEAYSVALHPSGLLMLVGFNDKLRLMNILIDDIRPYKEFTIRGCRECRFSNGGQYFAAVHGNTIQIFSTWTFENIGNLKGHNGKVRSVYFSSDDSRIISAGMDGAVYDWSMKDLKRDGENVLKSCSYTCAIASPDGHSLFAVGSDKMIKEIKDSQIVKEIESDVVLTQVVMSHSGKMMFGG
ncbi:WD40 repeat-like protein, partial [Rozella allomycis CSF55]